MMMDRLKPYVRGVMLAACAMVIYAVSLGFFLALALLVIAMEEGGNSLASYTVPLTQAVVLLSQGTGFHAGGITVGITPLLLSLALIMLIRALARHFSTDIRAWACGAIVWGAVNALFTHGLDVALNDSAAVAVLKSVLVFSIGFAWAAVPRSRMMLRSRTYCRAHISQPVRHAVCVGTMLALVLLGCYVVIGVGTVVAWIILDHGAMASLFSMLGMQNGSRIFMCLMALAWLPNVALWALSWLFGGAFHIGSIATFSLWSGSASDLPSLPVFALFPAAVDNATVRTVVMVIPVAVSLLAALVCFLVPKGFPLFAKPSGEHRSDARQVLVGFAYPAGAFCIAAVLVSLGSSLLFLLSNGSLGSDRLKSIGVDVAQSTQCVARPTAMGLFGAWLVAVIAFAAVFTVRWLFQRRRSTKISASAPAPAAASSQPKRRPQGPRSARSDRALRTDRAKGGATTQQPTGTKAPRRVNSTVPTKESKGDHQPTVTTGISVDLPQGRD